MVVKIFLLLLLAIPFTQAVIHVPAVAIDGYQEQFVPRGNDILLTCRYNASPPASEVRWIKDGTVIARNGSVAINDSRVKFPHHNESQAQLLITATTQKDAGNYTCFVINDVGNFSDTTSIVIQVVPDPPFNVKVDAKSSRVVNISWTAGPGGKSAILDYRVKYSVDNAAFVDIVCQGSLSDSTCVRSFTSASLVHLLPWTTYYIRVSARNIIGTSTGSSVVNATTDEEVPSDPPTLSLNVLSSTTIEVSWQILTKEKARGAILGYNIFYKTELGNVAWVNRTVDGGDTTYYLVTSLKKFTPYKVVMQAFNSKGASPQSAAVVKMTDQDKPDGAPENVTGEKRTSTAILVMWDEVQADLKNGIIKGYTIYFQSQTEYQYHNGYVNVSSSDRQKELSNLKKYVMYNITVSAFTVKGEGPHSAPVKVVRTDQDKPDGAPQNVRGENSSSTSISVMWEEVQADKQNGNITGYTITYQSQTENHNGNVNASSSDRQKELSNLKEYVNYTITVLAFTVKGNGPPSVPAIVVITDQDKPDGAPQNVRGQNSSSTRILVQWDKVPAEEQNGVIKGYTITYQSQTENDNGNVQASSSDRQKELTNLKKYVNYNITVLAFTEIGNGPPSDPVAVIRTDQDTPDGAPQNVRGQNSSSTSILVEWDEVPAEEQNGIIKGYTITYKSQTENHNGNVQASSSVNQKELTNLKEYVNYSITVLAFTVKGNGPPSDPAIVVITDQDKPSGTPQNLTLNDTTSTSILVVWNVVPANDRNGIIISYTVSYQAISGDGSNTSIHTTTVHADALQANLIGLVKSQEYRIRVLASTIKGDGNYSDPITDQTNQDKPGPAPQNLEGHNLTSTSILVTWGEVPAGKQHGHILRYTVIFKKVPGGTDQTKTVTDRKAELERLDKFSVYNIRVLAATIKGDGPPSDPIFVSTDQDKPSAAPSLIVVKTLDSTSIQLEWELVPLQYRHGYITKYVIHYTDEIKKGEMNVPASPLIATINGLKQSTTYTIQVLAATVKGYGPPSDPKSSTTEDPTTPSPPSDDDIGTTEVSINFVNKQTLSNGKPVRFYQIIVIPLTEGQNPGKSSDGKYVKITRAFEDKMEGEPYVTAEFANEKSQRTKFLVGDGKYYSRSYEASRKRRDTSLFNKYLNGKLDDNTKYAVFQRSFDKNGDYENEGFSKFTTMKVANQDEVAIEDEVPTVTVVLSIVVGLLLLIIVVGAIIMWRRFHHSETKTRSRNSQHCSTQEIVEMSASVNLATSQSAYCNPSTDPISYDNTNLPHYTEPATEGQTTYEAVDGQVANYDNVDPKQEDIYQEIDQGTHYQPLDLNREVNYEGFV